MKKAPDELDKLLLCVYYRGMTTIEDLERMPLEKKMKRLEQAYNFVIPENETVIIRLDGRAFHTYTKGLKRPFDDEFVAHMNTVAETVAAEVSGTRFAFTQSDEISLLVKKSKPESQAYFGNRIQKIVSISAALASATLARLRPDQRIPLFDSRVFTVPDDQTVEDYFVWRHRDTVKNSISSLAQTHFPHGHLQTKRREDMLKMLERAGVDWSALDDGVKYGRLTSSVTRVEEITFTHSRTGKKDTVVAPRRKWETVSAHDFMTDEGRKQLVSLI